MSLKRRLLIAGAGGFGREVFSWASDTLAQNPTHDLAGFINDDPKALDGFNYPIGIIGSITDYTPKENEDIVLAIGSPAGRKQVADTLSQKGASFYTLIHPSARVNHNVTLGKGVVLCPNVILANDSQLGDFVQINSFSTIAHDVHIGAYSTISGHCDITGHCLIGESVFFGSRAGTIPKIKIGDSATVGAGSTVMRSVRAGVSVLGNPAKKLL